MIEIFLKYLWEIPELVAKIIINSDINDVKNYLAPLFCNNFFQNTISPYSVEENLLYVIALLLKDEIEKLNSVNDLNIFLKITRCGYFLDELKKKSDVLTYAKTVIFSLIEKLENGSYISLNLDIYYLDKLIEKLTEEKSLSKDMGILEEFLFSNDLSGETKTKELKVDKKKEYLKIFEIDKMEEIENFNSKYMPSLDKDELEEITKNSNNKDMSDYITKYKNMLLSNPDIFSNEKIIDIICKMKHSDLLITLYQINFLKLFEFIDLLIELLLQNIKIMPKFIKYISKIIFHLIKNKFPEIKTIEINIFLGQFIFVNLLIPIFENPLDMNINDFVISNRTLDNLKILFEVFTQLILGNLFTSENHQIQYKPFNRYFIEKMPKILEFYNHLININCPYFIEKFINGKLEDDFKYNYFNKVDEKNQILIVHRSFFFSLNEIISLINYMNNFEIILFAKNEENNNNIYKIFKKLNSSYYKKILIDKKYVEDKNKNNKTKKMILFTDLSVNPKYEYLFNIELIKPYFYIKELKNITNKEESIKNNIIKSKNYISGLLYNCRDLESSEFSSEKTLDILTEIKAFLKTSEFVIDNSLPYEWYINSLLECLVLLPDNLSNDDFSSFYEEIKQDINNSIHILDFYKITDCFGKIKYIKNSIEFANKEINNIKDISLNEKVKNLIEKNNFDVLFQYNMSSFKIIKIRNKKVQNLDKNFNYIKCTTLNSFIRKFPNFNPKKRKNKNIKSLKLIQDFSIPKELNAYINEYTKYVIYKGKIPFTKEESIIIKNKIYDYVFKKLYYKIYPINPTEEDIIITNNCEKLSWTEPKHFFGNKKNNNYNFFMEDVKRLFNKLEKEKSPRLKLEIISEIFKTIKNVKTFNVEQSGVDDILNILVFIFVKVKPKFIDSDIKYMELFQNILEGDLESKFAFMKSTCNIISNIKSNNLIGVTEEEFENKFNASDSK